MAWCDGWRGVYRNPAATARFPFNRIGKLGARDLSAVMAPGDSAKLVLHSERNNSNAPNGEPLAERYERSAYLKNRRAIGDKLKLDSLS